MITFFAEDCPKIYAPQYGKIRVTGYGPDSVAYYSCDYGYDIYGPKSRKCQHDGSWYGDIPVCRPKRSKLCYTCSTLSADFYESSLQRIALNFMLQSMEKSE